MSSRLPTEDRQRQIVDATLRIIAEKGLGKFTTAAIAGQVGIAEGTIFRHFGSKEEIVAAAIQHIEQVFFDDFPPRHEDPITRLGLMFRKRTELVAAHPGIARLLFSDQLAQAVDEDTAAKVRVMQRGTLGFVRACLLEAAERRLMKEGLEVGALVVLVQGAAMALTHFGKDLENGAPLGELASRVWTALERSIRR